MARKVFVFSIIVIFTIFFIGNTRGYLCAHEKELVERERLRIKIYNSKRKSLRRPEGTETV